MQSVEKFSILDLHVHLHDNYRDWLEQRLAQNQGTHVVTLNAEMAIQAQKNPQLAALVRNAEVVVPDGAGVVLYARSQGKKVDRCPGIELAESLIRSAARQGWRIFLIGGGEGIAQSVAAQWQAQFPDLAIAGVHNGYFDRAEEEIILSQLQTIQPDLILVGLGVPRQEFWIQSQRSLCPHATWIGVGGSFDVWSGTKTRAPKWLRDNHLEWVYRLYQEPWRWRRMLALPYFVWCVTLQSLSRMFEFSR
ncbi:WecB/TagA/CpsF family glycosyltransferase [Pseudanabaena sp. PCC 6802]|uniref:WecB/TagA/CpsF family glycosyltransferase n=1 Tax=Pseudanabaena sp. PCC 6802 TaxID=118173 RepID=UPI000348E27A|nr:WecB/TagA/CpsF family glycosyltransferase [Pseudanabaena sp. PCC 6802]